MTGTSHEEQYIFLILSRSVLLTMRNVSEKFVEKIRRHILCSITLSGQLCSNVEKIWYKRLPQDGTFISLVFVFDNIGLYIFMYHYVVHPHTQCRGTMLQQGF